MLKGIEDVRERARQWLFDEAAPLWSTIGVCEDGQFAERLTLEGKQVEMDRRLRVQARQIYSFCAIGELGWEGPWRPVVEKAVDKLITDGRRSDGLFVHLFNRQGEVVRTELDLYDHAFALFALAHAGRVLDRPDLLQIANEVQDVLDAKWWRPEGGFWEGELTPCPPYRQNPHMHMFEAALAHRRAGSGERWGVLAERLAGLFREKFRDPGTGCVTEYFDKDWQKVPGDEGRIVEPGHCLEWAWLFETGFADTALSDGLVGFAREFGICSNRGVAVNEVYLDGAIRDNNARLWPQTERLKAAVARWKRTSAPDEEKEVVLAYEGLAKYFATPAKGVWYDKMKVDGSFVSEDAPASSFYHIVCAISELLSR